MTPMVRPLSSMVVLWATVSIPSANPLTITTPFLQSVFVMSAATPRPVVDAFRDPTIAALGLGRGITIGPAAKISRGANFLSTSLRGPNNSSGDKVEDFCCAGADLTPGGTSPIFSCHKVIVLLPSSPTWLTGLLRGDNTILSRSNPPKMLFKHESPPKLHLFRNLPSNRCCLESEGNRAVTTAEVRRRDSYETSDGTEAIAHTTR